MPVIQKLFQTFFGETLDIRDLMQLFNNVMDRFFDLFYCIITKSPGELFQGIFFLCRKKSDTAAQKLCLVFLWNIQFIRASIPASCRAARMVRRTIPSLII